MVFINSKTLSTGISDDIENDEAPIQVLVKVLCLFFKYLTREHPELIIFLLLKTTEV